MPSFANSALRLLRHLLGAPTRAAGPYAGEPTALDGNTAVAVTEAAIAELAALGASFPADAADLAWRTEQLRRGRNGFGDALGNQGAEGPRGALAAALGLAMGGDPRHGLSVRPRPGRGAGSAAARGRATLTPGGPPRQPGAARSRDRHG